MRKNNLHATFLKKQMFEIRCKPDFSARIMQVSSPFQRGSMKLWVHYFDLRVIQNLLGMKEIKMLK